jgi:hypothetical protein
MSVETTSAWSMVCSAEALRVLVQIPFFIHQAQISHDFVSEPQARSANDI